MSVLRKYVYLIFMASSVVCLAQAAAPMGKTYCRIPCVSVLLIGNGKYPNGQELEAPAKDVLAIKSALTSRKILHLAVVENGTKEQMQSQFKSYRDWLRLCKPDQSLIYYTGGSVLIDGFHYLLPIDVNIKSSKELVASSIDAHSWHLALAQLELHNETESIAMFDTSLDNPYSVESKQSMQRFVEASRPFKIFYATKPGQIAQDSADKNDWNGFNGLFTEAVSEVMVRVRGYGVPSWLDGIGIVTEQVMRKSKGQQQPWHSGDWANVYSARAKGERMAGYVGREIPPECEQSKDHKR